MSNTKVKGVDGFRDNNSGAIVMNSNREYQEAVRRKRQAKLEDKKDLEIRSLKKDVAHLTSLVHTLINNSNKE